MRTPLIEKIIGTTEIHKILIEKILSEYEKGQEEGESIHITDSSNLPMILRPQGQIIQDTRNGYNLYNINDMNTLNFATIEENDFIKASYDNTEGTGAKYSDIYTNKTTNVTANTDYYIISEIKEVSGTGIYFPCTSDFVNSLMASQISYSFVNLHDGDIIINKIKTKEDFSGLSGFLRTIVKYETGQAGSITFRLSVIPASLGEITEENFEYEAFGQMPSTNFPSAIKYAKGNYNSNIRNKNLFKAYQNSGSVLNNGITCEMLSYNKFNLNGTSTSESWIEIGSNFIAGTSESYISKFINLDAAKKYKYQIKKINGNVSANVNIHLQFLPTSGNKGLTISPTSDNPNIEISDSDGIYRTWIYLPNGITCNNLIIEIQIEESDEATEIIEPQSQNLSLMLPEEIKLYGKEDGFIYLTEEQATELELIGEGWYVYNKWKEYVATGNENWVLETNVTNTNGFYQYRINNFLTNVQSNPEIFNLENGAYCNYFPKNTGTINNTVKEEFTIAGSTGTVVVNSVFATVEEFKAWLQEINTSGKPFKIVYLLEKPVYTKINDKHFIKQLENLEKVFAYEGVTNIDTYSSDDKEKAPLIISAEYLKSQKIINKNLETRITALENALINNI